MKMVRTELEIKFIDTATKPWSLGEAKGFEDALRALAEDYGLALMGLQMQQSVEYSEFG